MAVHHATRQCGARHEPRTRGWDEVTCPACLAARTRQAMAPRFKRERRMRGLTQREMADLMGIGPTTYAKWEQGNATPSRMACQFLQHLERTIR